MVLCIDRWAERRRSSTGAPFSTQISYPLHNNPSPAKSHASVWQTASGGSASRCHTEGPWHQQRRGHPILGTLAGWRVDNSLQFHDALRLQMHREAID